MKYKTEFGLIVISLLLLSANCGCTKQTATSPGGYRIVHDTDDQSIVSVALRSDGGLMYSLINTNSENSRSLSYGLMGVSNSGGMEFHKREDYYFGNITFNSILESSPGIFLGLGYNSASAANRRSILARFDQTGQILDSIVLLVNNARTRYGKIRRLSDGNFLLMTCCTGSGGRTASYFLKFTENLVKIWDRVIEGSDLGITHFRGFDFTETTSGSFIAAGINSPLSTVNGMYNEGRLAVVKLTADGQQDTFHVLQYARYRVIGSVVLDNEKIYVLSSTRIIEDAGGKRELSINTFNQNLDSMSQRRIRHGQEAWLDANFLIKRKGGWFASGFTESGQTFFYFAQKPFLFMLDEQLNIVSTRRFGSERVASFVQMLPAPGGTYMLTYGDYLPGSTRYGYDIIIEELNDEGKIIR